MNKSGYISGIILGTGLWLVAAPLSFGQSQDLNKLVNQRHQFQEAEKALKLGQLSRYRRLEKQLRDYPLHPYLEYVDLKRRLGKAKPEEVKSFLDSKNIITPSEEIPEEKYEIIENETLSPDES